MIQRKTVRSDPTADVHADGGHLLAIHPHAGAPWDASGDNLKLRERIDDHLFSGAHISAYVAFPFSQIQDGIADDLAGTVIGDVAATVGGMIVDPRAAEGGFASQKIL